MGRDFESMLLRWLVWGGKVAERCGLWGGGCDGVLGGEGPGEDWRGGS